MMTLETTSAEETEACARAIGERLRGGETIELVSDLGGGKTTFVRGLARGLGSKDRVASPTFTVSRVYRAGSKELHHFDFYRLTDAGIMSHEVSELVGDDDCILVVEWAGAIQHVLPDDRLTIRLLHTGENSRRLEISYPKSLQYLVEELC